MCDMTLRPAQMCLIFIFYLFLKFCFEVWFVSQTSEGGWRCSFRSKYLITLEAAKAEEELSENKPTKYFVTAYEHFIMETNSNEFNFYVFVLHW